MGWLHEKRHPSLYVEAEMRRMNSSGTAPAPDCFTAIFKAGVWNKEIYVRMQGASEFAMSGVLENFNTTPRLPSILRPVLLTSGKVQLFRCLEGVSS